jgi:hypothetical protein
MDPREDPSPRSIPAVVLIHQEGVIALIALVGLWFGSDGLAAALEPRGPVAVVILLGFGAGLGCAFVFWLLRRLPALNDLESWQRGMVRGWSLTDAGAVAVFSGLAEEALIRALLQPVIGLLPAALLFAALHFVPDRKLWMWPVLALALGVTLGWIFEVGGYPAAASAHVAINAFALIRLRSGAVE